MHLLLLVAALPHLLWDQVAVPCVAIKAGTGSGFCVLERLPGDLVKVPAPGVRWATRGAGTASATAAPWITANGWRFLREPGKKYLYEAPRGSAVLAAAEAAAYGVEAYVRVDPEDLKQAGAFLEFLKAVGDDTGLKPSANIAVVDDGSRLIPEALNMMARRNLLFRVVKAPDASADLNVRIGSPEFPNALAANPAKLADEVRKQLTDRKRSLRIFGTESVLGRMQIGTGRARVHLLNYTTSRVEEVRIRVLGSYTVDRMAVFGEDGTAASEYEMQDGVTEFTVPVMGPYSVIDLKSVK